MVVLSNLAESCSPVLDLYVFQSFLNDLKDQMLWGIIFIMVFAFLFVPLPLVAYIFLGFFAVLCKLPRLHGDDNEDGSDDE